MSSEEDKYIIVDEIALEEGIRKGGNSIIRKLHVERPIDGEVLYTTIMKAWKTHRPFTFWDLSFNTFVFHFKSNLDMENVMQ